MGEYVSKIKAYFTCATLCAQHYDFGLVRIEDNKVKDGFGKDDFIYTTGIGGEAINSLDRFSKFIEMIHAKRTSLKESYEEVVNFSKK